METCFRGVPRQWKHVSDVSDSFPHNGNLFCPVSRGMENGSARLADGNGVGGGFEGGRGIGGTKKAPRAGSFSDDGEWRGDQKVRPREATRERSFSSLPAAGSELYLSSSETERTRFAATLVSREMPAFRR